MRTIKLTGIYIYPIKSAAGFSWETAEVTKQGFQYDRRWMLVDETGKFMTQRQFPSMALISVQVKGDYLIVNAPDRESLSIPIHLDILDRVSVQVWRDVCEAIPLGKEVDLWFTDFLGIACQLVYMPESSFRPVNPNYATNNEQVSFADGYPFLLISEASLQDLNSRLDESIPMNRFRPNLVVSGCEAFAEDSWGSIRIGSIPFRVVKPCERCVVTTVDQATGIRGKEPLSTLTKYRNREGKILFGQNLIQEQLGMLRVGDLVEVF
ncbi:MAG: MOSC domain-containing protein [Potamolinea sp.]